MLSSMFVRESDKRSAQFSGNVRSASGKPLTWRRPALIRAAISISLAP